VRTVTMQEGLKDVIRYAALGGAIGVTSDAVQTGKAMAVAGTVGTLNYAIDHIAKLYGPVAAHHIAVRALFDPRVYKQVTKKVGLKEGEAVAASLMSSFAKRGVIYADDFATLEGEF
jgi:hypothetical protein